MNFEPDSWLAQVFGYPVFKVSFPDQNDESSSDCSLSKVLCDLGRGDSAFFYAKVPTHRVDQVRTLVKEGFSVIDVNVTLKCDPTSQHRQEPKECITVRNYASSDREPLLSIASSCFRFSRFHLDPQIPGALASTIKRAWVDSYCRKLRGESLFVAELEGKLAGFIALLRNQTQSGWDRIIDLVGVDTAHQRRGVGRRLVDYVVNDAAGRASSIKVGTQVANAPSIRLYEKAGFCWLNSTYVLHAHVGGGELRR